MTVPDNYFDVLGIGPDAGAKEIKSAYRYKVNILHPDRLTGASDSIRDRAEEDLKRVNRAYAVLSDPRKREKYRSTWSTNPVPGGVMSDTLSGTDKAAVVLGGVLGALIAVRSVLRILSWRRR